MTDRSPSQAGEPTTMVDPDMVPNALKKVDQWVCWRTEDRDGKPTKVPIDPVADNYASVTDSATWTDFDTAYQYSQQMVVDGVGFVFRDDGPYAGIDLDDCRNPETGIVEEWAGDIVAQLDSYTERSPSGTGLHILVEGALPAGGSRTGELELYDQARYFTVTGDHVAGTPTSVEQRTAALRSLYEDYVDTGDESALDTAGPPTRDRSGESPAADKDVIERACTAANGGRFERLWTGDTAGYESHSEADMALCCYLAFWTGGDAAQVDRLFRQSGLMRDKWDTVHYSDGSTYGEKTVQRAIALVDEGYTDR